MQTPIQSPMQPPDLPPHFEKFLNALFDNVNEKISMLNDKLDALSKSISTNRDELHGVNSRCVDRCRVEMNEVYDRLRELEKGHELQNQKINSHLEEFEKIEDEKRVQQTEKSQWSQANAGWLNAFTAIMMFLLAMYTIFSPLWKG